MTQPALLPHAAAIITRLDNWPALASVTVGDHVAPKSGTPATIVAPAVVFYLRPGGQQSGTLGEKNTDAWLPFQLTCIGLTATQAMLVADWSHQALVSSLLSVDDRFVCRAERRSFGSAAQRDNAVTPPLFYVPVEYRLWTIDDTPSS